MLVLLLPLRDLHANIENVKASVVRDSKNPS